jgi:hypothetical protein
MSHAWPLHTATENPTFPLNTPPLSSLIPIISLSLSLLTSSLPHLLFSPTLSLLSLSLPRSSSFWSPLPFFHSLLLFFLLRSCRARPLFPSLIFFPLADERERDNLSHLLLTDALLSLTLVVADEEVPTHPVLASDHVAFSTTLCRPSLI